MRLSPLVSSIIFLSFFVSCSQNEAPKPHLSKIDKIAQMAEEEIEMTKDPFTNEVPKHTLYKVRKELLKSEQYKSLSSEDDWIARGPNDVGGRTRALLVDIRDTTHNTLFAGSVSGGLWKCTNAQIDPIWERVETYLGNPSICSIVQDPANPEIIYLGTGEGFFNGDAYRGDGIYKSSDGGVNWSRLSSTNHGNFFYNQKLVINDEGDLFVATRGNGVMRSTTGGESWTPVLNNTNQGFSDRAADIEIAPDGTIFASMGLFTQDGLYRSKDGGIDWEYIELGIDSFERIEIAVSKTDTNAVLILVQEMENNAVGFVMTSSDGGDTWEQKRVPEKASGAPMAEGQAWYDMSAAIDPNDSNVYYVGGVDLYKSVNGGEGWRIVSSWFGGGGYPYVHADQHSIHFLGNSSDKAYFTNDGGLWFTENATEPRPDFRDLSGGYITTQYYACAIHPEFGKDYYIGGSQDNGSELINGPGLSSSVGLTGGDGAYCHIDQLDPNIQITSSQRGNYNVTTVGNFSEREGYSNPGDAYFINPTDYDDFTKTLYTSHNSNQYFWFDVLTGERDSVIINELNGDRVTALLASPIDSTILYLGTNNGIILKVTNPRQPIANAEVLFRGPGFTRNIDVDLSDPDRLLCTYSNFAIQSVYLSENGGDNWRSLEGNLPNIPVRWGVFNPSFPEEIIIATEVGVWITSTINSSVEWENISGNLGLGRVNMLKFRQSDFQMLAASYGKGMFTTNMFAKKGLQFEEDKIAIEINGDIVNESCDPISTESVKIFTSFPFDQDVEITVEADTASTAQEGVDFIINEPTVILPAGETEYNFEISVFDNATIETNKKLILNMTSPEEVLKGSVEVTLLENDQFFSDGVTGIAVNIGDDDRQTSSIFKGSFEDSKTQLLYTRDVLFTNRLNKGEIRKIFFDISRKLSTAEYKNLTISLGLTDKTSLTEIDTVTFLTEVYSGNFQTFEGINLIFLDTPFEYDGESGILMQVCFDNDEFSGDDFMFSTEVDYDAVFSVSNYGQVGCVETGFVLGTPFLPNFTFESFGISALYENTSTMFQSTLGDDEVAYFQTNDSILCSIAKLNSDNTDGCFTASLVSVSDEVVEENNAFWVDRIISISSDVTDDENFEVTYFMPLENSEFWQRPHIEALYTETILSPSSIPDWQSIPIISSYETDNYYSFTVKYQGEGSYGIGIADRTVNTSELVNNFDYDEIRYFDLLGREYKDLANQNTQRIGIYIKSYIKDKKIIKSEKILINQ